MVTSRKTETFEINLYSLAVHAQGCDRFNPVKMFAPYSEDNGVYIQAVMEPAHKLIHSLGIASTPDERTRVTVGFSRVAEKKKANPAKIYRELIGHSSTHSSVSLSVLHFILRLYGNVSESNGLGEIIPKELYKSLIVPHHTTSGWMMIRSVNLGSRRRPSWIIDMDPLVNFAYDYRAGSVVMMVE